MSRRFDVIVIGAGLGGMTAATRLAQKGMKTLLLERHFVPGGYATSFVRGRFEFEVALHELSGVGPDGRGDTAGILGALGVADKVRFLRVRDLYRSIFPDLDVTLPSGRAEYEAAVCGIFPSSAPGIRRFLSRIDDVYREFAALSSDPHRPNPLTIPFRYPNVARYLPLTWGEVLSRDVPEPRARSVLSQYWGYFGMPPSRLNFLYFALGLASYMKYGATYVDGRSQALSNAFVARFEELGGEVHFGRGVRSIRTEGGRVAGVETDDGEMYEASRVVSNADPVTTCRSLLGDGAYPVEWLQHMGISRPAAGTINVYMGLDRAPGDVGLTTHENFINPDDDHDAIWEGTRRLEPPRAVLATLYNHVWPAISPPGTSIVVLTALSYGAPWVSLPPARYYDTKMRLAETMIATAERHAPGLRDACEVVEVATPLTNMRYAGALGGSIYGFDQPPFDGFALRAGHRGPVPGLWMTGAWTQPGGGFGPCIASGWMAADAVVRSARKAGKRGHA